MTIVDLPATAHLSIIRRFIETERGMRVRVLKGERQREAIKEADEALRSLELVEKAVRRKHERDA